jgi:hypothetical protein
VKPHPALAQALLQAVFARLAAMDLLGFELRDECIKPSQ